MADKKTYANVQKKMLEYYKNQDLVKYGVYLNEQRDYPFSVSGFWSASLMAARAPEKSGVSCRAKFLAFLMLAFCAKQPALMSTKTAKNNVFFIVILRFRC